jgi:hypothetical protein
MNAEQDTSGGSQKTGLGQSPPPNFEIGRLMAGGMLAVAVAALMAISNGRLDGVWHRRAAMCFAVALPTLAASVFWMSSPVHSRKKRTFFVDWMPVVGAITSFVGLAMFFRGYSEQAGAAFALAGIASIAAVYWADRA